MARISIIFGLVLCGLTIVGISATTQKSYTQFVPMMFGIPALFLGVISLNPHRRSAATWFALAISVLATVLGAIRLIVFAMEWSSGGHIRPVSFRLVLAMTLAAAVFTLITWVWQRKRRAGDLVVADEPPFGDQPSPLTTKEPHRDSPNEPEAIRANPYRSPRLVSDESVSLSGPEPAVHPDTARPGTSGSGTSGPGDASPLVHSDS